MARPPGARTGAIARLPLLLPGACALLGGLYAALMLLGLPVTPVNGLPEAHGVLLVLGFVGTLIALERAIALGHWSGFLSPLLLGLGALLVMAPAPPAAGRLALVVGSAALAGLYLPLWQRQHDDAVLVQLLGAVLATAAALLWLRGTPVPVIIPWLAGFVVLTIAGERLELARIAMGPGAGGVLIALAAALMVAMIGALLWPATTPLVGLAVVALVGWLGTHDVARRTVKSKGLARHMAFAMLGGYGWLAVAGLTWLLAGPVREGGAYDALVHAIFLGFTLSMIIAHAPVILPAVVRRPLPYHPAMYGPLALLHASLVLRLWVGDALGVSWAWQAGGVLGIVAVLGFLGVAAWRVAGGGKSKVAAEPRPGVAT